MNGAGGTTGGVGQFFTGLIMMCGGLYLLFNSISVTSHFGLGERLYGFSMLGSHFSVTGGMIMIPFMFGIGFIFFNGRNWAGWLLTVGSLVALIFGVLSSIRFSFRAMTAFELISILVLAVGGFGLFVRSLVTIEKRYPD